jgi:diguanylate cyclase (GGDEF)-like protein
MDHRSRDYSTSDPPERNPLLRAGTIALICFLIYFIADTALNLFAFSAGWTILWPLNGIVIAMRISRPKEDWPAMLIGIEAGVGLGEFLDSNAFDTTLWQRLFSLIEVALSAWFLPQFTTLETWLHKPRIFLRFVAALVVGPLVSGLMAATYFHITKHQLVLSALDDWATADALGIAAIMPLALSVRSPEMKALFDAKNAIRTIALLALALAVATCVFSVSQYPLLFLLYPTLLLVDSVLGFSGSAIAAVIVSFFAVYLTTHGIGPFGKWPMALPVTRDVAFQLFLGFHLVALFPASLMIMERRRMAAELRDSNAQLLLLASLDGLTGIANRRSLDERFSQEWTRAIRVQTPLALVMIDIDHFKQFNDLYGHHAGDLCLQSVASVLQAKMQRGQDHLARFGGEEFALLLPHTDLQGALHIAEQMRLAVLELSIEHRNAPAGQITVSLGCAAVTPIHGEPESRLLESADAALYEAKLAGRNRVHAAEYDSRHVDVST